jgi:hypothetical protein
MENAAVPVRPIHHRRATKFPSIISHLVISVGPVLKARHLCTLISLRFLVPKLIVGLSGQFQPVRCYNFTTSLQ